MINFCKDCYKRICYDSIRCLICEYKQRKGKSKSDKHKQHISKALKGIKITWAHKLRGPRPQMKGKNNPMFGIKRPDLIIYNRSQKHHIAVRKALKGKNKSNDAKKKMSISAQIRCKTKLGKLNLCKAGLLGRLNNKHKNTLPERILQKALKQKNIRFQTHKIIENICKPDIIIQNKKIIIQVDGDYWHRIPNNRKRDYRQDKILRNKNWTILRFWEHDIKQNLNNCLSKIDMYL